MVNCRTPLSSRYPRKGRTPIATVRAWAWSSSNISPCANGWGHFFLPAFLLKSPISLRERSRPGLGIIEPCLRSSCEGAAKRSRLAARNIKRDGFRIMEALYAGLRGTHEAEPTKPSEQSYD
jgi:hypothetical protein